MSLPTVTRLAGPASRWTFDGSDDNSVALYDGQGSEMIFEGNFALFIDGESLDLRRVERTPAGMNLAAVRVEARPGPSRHAPPKAAPSAPTPAPTASTGKRHGPTPRN